MDMLMTPHQQFFAVLTSIIVFFLILELVRRRRLREEYSWLWLLTGAAMIVLAVWERLGYVPGRWAFWRCRECGSAVLSPFPKANELASLYPPVYSFALDLGRENPFRRFLARLEYRFFFRPQYEAQARRVLRGIDWQGARGQRLLDVGCGPGLRLITFRRRGFDVRGMDFQPEVVEYLRKELGIPAVCTDVHGLAECFPPTSFDLITAFSVLEHVPSVEAALESCFRLLNPCRWLV